MDELLATGAVLVGRRTAEHAGYSGGDHHHGVRIFVVSHRPPGPEVAPYPLVTYVTDGVESAVAQAKAAAGDRNVLVLERLRRNERSKLGCSTSCRSTRPRCPSALVDDCATCCRRTSSWRSCG